MTRWLIGSLALVAGCGVSDPVDDGVPSEDDNVELRMRAIGPDPSDVEAFQAGLVEIPEVAAHAEGHALRLVHFEALKGEMDEGRYGPTTAYSAVVYDYDAKAYFQVTGDMKTPSAVTIAPSEDRPAPTLNEVDDAVQLMLADDPELAARVAAGEVQIFRAMPPLIEQEDGSRVFPLGVREVEGGDDVGREIVGIDLGLLDVIHYEGGAPATASITGFACNPAPSSGQSSAQNQQGWAAIEVDHEGERIWDFIVTRPAASSGGDGSGVDVTDVKYRGKTILKQGHVPILNVLYDGNACGPYRDWQYQEHPFSVGPTISQEANGVRIVEWAKTMIETKDDSGNFTGVASYWDRVNQEAVVVSELTAGWYRYKTEWRFALDGTITGRFGFDAVANGCTCQRHFHHTYWRLDLDVGDGTNVVEQHTNAGGWTSVNTELQANRDWSDDKYWRVSDPQSGDSVLVYNGRREDAPDTYGIADAWFLRQRASELDDTNAPQGTQGYTQARLPSFVNGESINNEDVVMWAGGHFVHDDSDPNTNQSHTTTITIVPESW